MSEGNGTKRRVRGESAGKASRKPQAGKGARSGALETETVTFSASVPLARAPRFISQAELAEWFNVTERSVLNWEGHGLPVDRSTGRFPRYPVRDATIWASEYTLQCLQARIVGGPTTPGPAHLSLREAWEGQLRREREIMKIAPERWAVLVPLWHDHPMRRELLKIAAEGLESPTTCTCGEKNCPIHGGA